MAAPYAPLVRPQYYRAGFTTPPQAPPPARQPFVQFVAAVADVTLVAPPAGASAGAPAPSLTVTTLVASGGGGGGQPGYQVTLTYDPLGLGVRTLAWANTGGPLSVTLTATAQPPFVRTNQVGTGQATLPVGYVYDIGFDTTISWSTS